MIYYHTTDIISRVYTYLSSISVLIRNIYIYILFTLSLHLYPRNRDNREMFRGVLLSDETRAVFERNSRTVAEEIGSPLGHVTRYSLSVNVS